MSTTVAVFLDFDGVLHPQLCWQHNVLCRMYLVEDVLREFKDDIEIVVSSSWRDHHSLDELRNIFSADSLRVCAGIMPSTMPKRIESGGLPPVETSSGLQTCEGGSGDAA